MKYQLSVIAGPEAGRTFSIEDGESLTIGRGQASDTQISDPRMSRVHCQIQVEGGKAGLADKGSSSGSFVNGQQLMEKDLTPGDVIQLGDSKIRFSIDGDQEESTLLGTAFGHAKPTAKVTPLQDLVGQSLAHFRLDGIISKGHAGMVFKGYDTETDRVVAVKVLAPEYGQSEEEKQRFVRAMKTMMPMQHENIVQLYAAGKHGPHCWAAMEYVDGQSLADVIQEIGTAGMLDWRDTFRVAVHIGRALECANENKIIHRNVTPQNILRRASDKVTKLGDLMLAKALQGTLAKQVTQPGQLVGDVPYMSPERTRQDANTDGRSDIYELGATLYALLTGRPPFEDNSLPVLIKKVREETPEKPKKYHLAIPDQFQDIVMMMMAKRPDDRYRTPSALLKELRRVGMFQGIEIDKL